MSKYRGGFTLPGEAGYEELTLRMAEKWGADVIRDSDGTTLSDDILEAGYGIYSTICIIRDHNAWAREHPDQLQQSFLMAGPVVAETETLSVSLMAQFYEQQFRINDSADSLRYWQVYDRTTGTPVPGERWDYDGQSGCVNLKGLTPYHSYTVSFLAYQIWEQISMYNHVTNDWGEREHLMPVDPRHPETAVYLLGWLENWCVTHPATTVVRFTSLFYNFTWMWGSDERNRNLFTDWGSYDFTVSPAALDAFAAEYGYFMTAEDFVNQGKFQVSHMPATQRKRDWMDFTNAFVTRLGKQMVELVHRYGKKAYVFYDDSWVGMEPYGERFSQIGFDGLIKCVFSGYEARLCGGVEVETHEIRLHPYLFPVGLGGAPTFMEGGDPTKDAKDYWVRVRRGLLRVMIQRIGLGGYLHLTEGFPDFQDYIEEISDEFRELVSCHESGIPRTLGIRTAVLHYWGKLRSWTLSGHFHETFMHDLIHVNEALAGLPLDVDFISFEDVRAGRLADYDVVINAGRAGDAWSGGDDWKDPSVVEAVTKFVYEGGTLIGICEPSAAEGFDTFFRMASVLGVDQDNGARVCHGKWRFETELPEKILEVTGDGGRTLQELLRSTSLPRRDGRFLTDGRAKVLLSHPSPFGEAVDLAWNACGRGTGIYFGGFSYTPENTRLLLELILLSQGRDPAREQYISDNPYVECAYFPVGDKLVVVNQSGQEQRASVLLEGRRAEVRVPAFGQRILSLEG